MEIFPLVKLCEKGDSWKPLLLIIPLRLGLSEVNPIYINGLKRTFEIPGTLGLIGGRPNQAHYFIGYVGDEAIYLDPHTTQKCGTVGDKTTSSEVDMDETYHQKYASRIHFEKMDPSLALVSFLFQYVKYFHVDCCGRRFHFYFSSSICLFGGQCFLCKTRTEFDDLCATLKKDIISTGSQTLFEITETSQVPWRPNPLNLYQSQSTNTQLGHSPNSNGKLFK